MENKQFIIYDNSQELIANLLIEVIKNNSSKLFDYEALELFNFDFPAYNQHDGELIYVGNNKDRIREIIKHNPDKEIKVISSVSLNDDKSDLLPKQVKILCYHNPLGFVNVANDFIEGFHLPICDLYSRTEQELLKLISWWGLLGVNLKGVLFNSHLHDEYIDYTNKYIANIEKKINETTFLKEGIIYVRQGSTNPAFFSIVDEMFPDECQTIELTDVNPIDPTNTNQRSSDKYKFVRVNGNWVRLPRTMEDVEFALSLYQPPTTEIEDIIYVDSDGVVADWVSWMIEQINHADITTQRELNKHPNRTELIKEVYKREPNAFYLLPVIEDGRRLIESLKQSGKKFKILTAIGDQENTKQAHECKLEFYQEWFDLPLTDIIIVKESKDKLKYCEGHNTVLIDDYDLNCDTWKQAGGVSMFYDGTEGSMTDIIETLLRD